MILLEFVPTYEYECPRCPRVFEVRQRISEPALSTCERCGGPVRRLLSATPFILKGGGWYVTDYPSEARKKAQGSESSPPAAAASEPKSSTGSGTAPPSSGKTEGGSAGSGGASRDSAKTSDSGKTASGS